MLPPLAPHPVLRRRPGPVVLAILDGVGIGGGGDDDAVQRARAPVLHGLMRDHPTRQLRAHGTAVGLPSDDDMGNSEVGHNAMGAGRVFDQGAKLIERGLADGTLFANPLWAELVRCRCLHLLGLVSDGNVHSHVDHLYALIARAAADGVRRLRVHALTDGRDVAPRSALTWIRPLEDLLAGHRAAGRDYAIGSGGGRMRITMDRYEADWAMVERGWRCHVRGEGRPFPSATAAIEALYAEDPQVDDQRLPAFVVSGSNGPIGRIEDGDGVVLFNFRGDRALEICNAFEDDDFPHFARPDRPDVLFAGMMGYDGDRHVPRRYLVSPPAIDRTVSEYLAAAGLRSLACAETQKFGHVTYFFNGNRSGRADPTLETWVEVPSLDQPFDEVPAMSAAQVTDVVVRALEQGNLQHLRLNWANGDMVGHTGNLAATIQAIEAVDAQLGRLVDAVRRADGVLLVTADHGNADEMWMHKGSKVLRDAAGAPQVRTSHTLNPVPFIVFDPRGQLRLADLDGAEPAGIASVGSTVLELCGLSAPDGYAPGLVTL